MRLTFNILLIATFYKSMANSNMRDDIYVKNVNISCCPLEDHGPLTEISCSLQCTLLDQVCGGFGLTDSVCKLCFVCLTSSNQNTSVNGYARKLIAGKDDFEGM